MADENFAQDDKPVRLAQLGASPVTKVASLLVLFIRRRIAHHI
jgi:hypothetical protein